MNVPAEWTAQSLRDYLTVMIANIRQAWEDDPAQTWPEVRDRVVNMPDFRAHDWPGLDLVRRLDAETEAGTGLFIFSEDEVAAYIDGIATQWDQANLTEEGGDLSESEELSVPEEMEFDPSESLAVGAAESAMAPESQPGGPKSVSPEAQVAEPLAERDTVLPEDPVTDQDIIAGAVDDVAIPALLDLLAEMPELADLPPEALSEIVERALTEYGSS